MNHLLQSCGVSQAYGVIIEELEDAQLQLQTLLSMRHVTPFREIVQVGFVEVVAFSIVLAEDKQLSLQSNGLGSECVTGYYPDAPTRHTCHHYRRYSNGGEARFKRSAREETCGGLSK